MNNKSIKIMVASHKDYEFPADKGYFPVQVGKALNKAIYGVTGDDLGDNISLLNKSFCELTGLYWLWKNQEADFLGLVHYRRYFKSLFDKSVKVNTLSIASSNDLIALMENFDVIVPKQRCYFIETVRSHYERAHYASDLNVLREVIGEEAPEYINAFEKVFSSHCLSLYNMFLMERKYFNEYAAWLFDLLFKLEKRIPYQEYGPYQSRVFGFLAERLLNVWIEYNKASLRVKKLPVVNIEGENFILKALGLIQRRFLGKKKI